MRKPSTPRKYVAKDVTIDLFFAPKKKVVRQIGKTTIMMYPDINTKMTNNEHLLVFNINKNVSVNT